MKKGFTLVEIAIVLMVIGLILGMVMKGRSLIDAAQIKSEINKMNKIEAAYLSFLSKFNRRPGAVAGDNVTGDGIYRDLLHEGMVTGADFDAKYTGGFWNFTGCTKNKTDNGWVSVALKSSSNICLIISRESPEKNDDESGKVPQNNNNAKFICYIETTVDDKNLHSGQGMVTDPNVDPFNDFNDCDSLTDDSGVFSGSYLFRIF